MSITAAATGSQVRLALAREQELSIPGSESLVSFKPTLPSRAAMLRTENESGQINPSGFREKGLPGTITPAFDFGHILTSAHFLEILEHILRSASSAVVQTDFRAITFEGDSEGVSTDFYGFYGDDATRRYFGGLAFSGLEITSPGDNGPIVGRLVDPSFLWETDLSAPIVQGTNGGTFSGGPWVRGRLDQPSLGPLYFKIATAGVTTTVKFHQTDGVPFFPGDAITLSFDPVDSKHFWQAAQGARKIAGTVSVSAGTAAVTGTSTRFERDLAVGQEIYIDGETIAISAIASDTALTLAANHSAGASGAECHVINRDLGDIDENKEPLEFVFPGTQATHTTNFDEALTGTVSVTAGTAAVTGSGTAFQTELNEGDEVVIESESHIVSAIASDTSLTLATNHVAGASGASAVRIAVGGVLTGTVSASGTALTGSGTDFVNELNAGDTIRYADGTESVISSVTDATNAVLSASATQSGVVAYRVVNEWLCHEPGGWSDPAQTFRTGAQRFSSAHVTFKARAVGDSTYQEFKNLSSTYRILWPITPEIGEGSLFPTALDRDGDLHFEIEIERNLRGREFEEWAAQHERLELEIRIEGQQLGDGSIREGWVITAPAAVVLSRESPASGPERITESITIMGESNDAGDSPVTVVVTTPYTGFTAAS